MNDQKRIDRDRLLDSARHRACVGKTRFPSKKNATARARVLRRDVPRTPSRGPWNAYRCPECGHWHIGHRRIWTVTSPKLSRLAETLG